MRYSIIEKGGRLSKIIPDDCRLNNDELFRGERRNKFY